MSRATINQAVLPPVLQLNLLLVSWTGVAAFALLVRHSMTFEISSTLTAAGTIVLLTPFAVAFQRRGIHVFVNLLSGFLAMVGFNVFLTILTYAGAPLNAPLADDWLMHCDSLLGIHLPSIVMWIAEYPALKATLDAAYPSVMISTLLALVVLGLDRDESLLQNFVVQYMVAGLLTTVVFFMLPAEGPFAAYGYELRVDQQRFLNHFHALRDGRFHSVSLSRIEGLITFPSFHTAWALLLAWSFRGYRWLRIPMLVLNLGVVASTLTTGWHYGTDVIGGLAVAIVAVHTTRWLRRILLDEPGVRPEPELDSQLAAMVAAEPN